MIKVLIVDDSIVVRDFLTYIFSSDPQIMVVGAIDSGIKAVDMIRLTKPDVVTMDLHMPQMDGFETTRVIMEQAPTPIVVVSESIRIMDTTFSFSVLEAGALAVLLRPPSLSHPDFLTAKKELIETVKTMAEVKVVRRINRKMSEPKNTFENNKVLPKPLPGVRIIAIGASTGGPQTLQKIFSGLPPGLPFSFLVVQHISPGFSNGFRDWLQGSSRVHFKTGENGERLVPGMAYLAPEGFHMGILNNKIMLSSDPPVFGIRPTIDFLFRSLALSSGPESLGILLTGMGKDGSEALKLMKEKGALTIAQDQESSIVFGMPDEAIKLGAADYILPPDKIMEMIIRIGKI